MRSNEHFTQALMLLCCERWTWRTKEAYVELEERKNVKNLVSAPARPARAHER